MTSDDYRAKWGLAADYPMVSYAYSAARSEVSKALGLGRKKAIESIEAPAAEVRRKRSKPMAAVEALATAPESFQEPVEAPQATEARLNTAGPLEFEARLTLLESPVEPAEAQREAS